MACVNRSTVTIVQNHLNCVRRQFHNSEDNAAAELNRIGDDIVGNKEQTTFQALGRGQFERERRTSSSSNESESLPVRRKDKIRPKKAPKSGRKISITTASSDLAGRVENQITHATCTDCNSDLTDSDVEICQQCFGLRKLKVNVEDEVCPYPFSFIKKKYLPQWMHEPEYMMHPKPVEKRASQSEGLKSVKSDEQIHKNTDSLFSTSSGFTNYRGLLNLALILLVLSSTRLVLENLMKYGILIEPLQTVKKCLANMAYWPHLTILLWQSVHCLTALIVEYCLSRDYIPEAAGVVVHFTNGLLQLTLPAYVVLSEHPSPIFSAFILSIVTVLFLKLISYAHTNYWCRKHRIEHVAKQSHRRRQSASGDNSESPVSDHNGFILSPTSIVKYPDNINFKDMLYFVMAPTLCYEINFPRSARIRKRFLIKRLIEMVFLVMVIVGLFQQWIVPIINNSIKPLSELNVFKCVERLLKLSIPNHLIWLMFFYAFFHSMLNVIAELLMFGDREFYQDWWNAETISEFWQHWNIPVHRWASRHLYKPLRKRGVGSLPASGVVFFVSAFFHEYLVSVPLRMFKIWAFTGMLMQVPLAVLTSKNKDSKWGNIIVWLSLILGQPIAILAYVHDYYVMSLVSTGALDPRNTTSTYPHAEL